MKILGARRRAGAFLRGAAFLLAVGVTIKIVVVPITRLLGSRLNAKAGGRATLLAQLGSELILLIALTTLTALFVRMDRLSWKAVGLPLSHSALPPFLQGACLGIGGMGLTVGTLAALGGYSVHCWRYAPVSALSVAGLSAVSYLAVGIVEELWFRGYALQALARGVGFWPAAVLTSLTFGLWHAVNPGEFWQAELAIAFAGLTFCFLRWLTGSLWFGIGSHAAWDYMENVVFSNPGGSPTTEHLLRSSLHGPTWLTGGSAGLENSIVTLAVGLLLLLLPAIWFLPRRHSALLEL